MGTRIWSSTGSTDMNNGANYSGSGALLTSDDLVFDNTSVVNATATVDLDVGSVTIASNYSGAWSMSSYTLTVENNNGFSDAGITGGHNYGNGMTVNGTSASIIWNPGGTITMSTCVLTINGSSCTMNVSKAGTFKQFVIGEGGGITWTGSTSMAVSTANNPLVMGNNSRLTLNQIISFDVSNGSFHSIGSGCTCNGSAIWTFGSRGASATNTFPAFTLTGSGSLKFNLWTTATTQLTGMVNCGSLGFQIAGQTGIANPIFDFNNQSVICGAYSCGSAVTLTTGVPTVNYTGASMTVASYNSVVAGAANACYQNFLDSIWSIAGSWTQNANHIINPGTSSITFTDTSTITNVGKSIGNFTVNASGKTITLVDDIFCNTYTLTAGTVALSGFYIFQMSIANIWLAAANGSWNVAGNWSLGHVPTSGEDVVFNGLNSTKNCTWDVSPNINAFGVISNYSGALSASGYMTTSANGFSHYGTSTFHFGNGITCNGNSSSFYVAPTVGSLTESSCTITMNGTTGMFFNPKITLSNLNGLVLGLDAKVTMPSTASVCSSQTSGYALTLNAGCTFTMNQSFNFRRTTSGDLWFIGIGYVWNGTGGTTSGTAGADVSINIPETICGCTGSFIIRGNSTNHLIQFTGNCSFGGALILSSGSATVQTTVDFFGSNISCTQLRVGATTEATTGYTTHYFSTGTITCTSFGSASDSATSTINFETANINCSGAFLLTSGMNLDAGSSLITISATSTFTTASKAIYDLSITGGTLTCTGNMSCHNLSVSNAASWTNVSYTATFSGNATFNSTGTISAGTAWTFTGNTSNLSIASTQSTTTATSCVLTFSGNNCTMSMSKAANFVQLVLSGSAALILTHSVVCGTAPIAGTGLVLNNNSTLTFNATGAGEFSLRKGGSGDFYSIGTGCTINGNGPINFYANTSSLSLNVPAITYTGTAEITIGPVSGSLTGTTLNQTGNISVSGALNIGASGGVCQVTYNTNNYSISSGLFKFGASSAFTTGYFRIYFGSSTVICSSMLMDVSHDFGEMYWQTSTWTCSGAWYYVSTYTVDIGTTAQLTLSGTNSTITCAGLTFPKILATGGSTFSSATAVTIKEFICTAGKLYTFTAGTTWTISNATEGNWSGSAGSLVYFRSGTAQSQAIIALPNAISEDYINLADMSFTGFNLTAGSNSVGLLSNNSGVTWSGRTTNSWSAAGAGNWSTDANWSQGHKPTSSEDVVFDASSTQVCTVDENVNVKSLSITSDYTTNISFSGITITVSESISFVGPGTLNVGVSISLTGSGVFLLSSSVSLLTASSTTINLNGRYTSWRNNRGGTTWGVVTIKASAYVTADGSATSYYTGSPPLTLENDSTFIINQTIRFILDLDGDMYSLPANYTLGAVNNIYFFVKHGVFGNAPALVTSATVYFQPQENNSTCTIFQTGDIVSNGLGILTSTANSQLIFDTSGYSITSSNHISLGCGSADSFLDLNCEDSLISCVAFNYLVTGYSSGTVNLRMDTSTWTISGACTLRTTFYVTAGSSTVNLTGSSVNLVMNGNALHKVNVTAGQINATQTVYIDDGGTLTITSPGLLNIAPTITGDVFNFAGAYTVTGTGGISISPSTDSVTTTLQALTASNTGTLTVNASGSSSVFTMAGALSWAGSVTFTAAPTMNLNSSILMNGSTAALTFASGLGTVTATSCDISFSNATSSTLTDNKGVRIRTLTVANSSTFISNGSATTDVYHTSTPLIFGTNCSITITGNLDIFVNGNVDAYALGSGSTTVSGVGQIQIFPGSANKTIGLPAITRTATILCRASSNNTTYNQSGNISCGVFRSYCASQTGNVYNQNGYSITATSMTYGTSSSGTFIYNFDGTITVSGAVSSFTNAGTGCTINMGRSHWLVGGNWTFASLDTINHQWDSVTFTNTALITSVGKTFNYLLLNSPTKIITFNDDLVCRGYSNIAGTLNQNGKKFRVLGDITQVEVLSGAS